MNRVFALLCCNLFLTSTTEAQNETDSASSDLALAVGFAVFTEQSPYLDGQQRNEMAPYVEAYWGPLFFDGDTLGLYLFGGDTWGVATTVSYDMFGDSTRGDSKTLKDMTKLDDVYNASLVLYHESAFGDLSFEVATDISNEHDGNRAAFSYSLPFVMGRWTVSSQFGADWFSKEVSRYYVGVSRAEVKSSRNFYRPEGGVNYSAGITIEYSLSRHHHLIANVNRRFFSNEVTDSPIVSDSASTATVLSYTYRF